MADELPPSKFGRGYTYGGPPQGPGNSGPGGPRPAGRPGPAGPPPLPPPNWGPPQQNWPAGEPVPRPYPPQRRRREGKPWLWIGAAIVAVVALAGGVVWFVALRGDPSDSGSTSAAPAAPVMGTVPTVLILDASGSMAADDAPGPRIDAAKRAAQGLVDALPDEATIGLTTYGTGTGSTEGERAAGCQDVTTPIPLGPLVRDDMAARIAGVTPSGYTPISLALQRGADQLPADDSAQAIVLVSDGEDTCETPPCDTGRS